MDNMGKKDEQMDVFISYRRQGGATVAALLRRELVARGLRVFMDTEELKSGDYEQAILKNIKSAENFILLVSDSVFESKNVVWEVETVLSLPGKKIIPVFINNNNNFSNTPAQIKSIEKQNGIVLNHLNPQQALNYLVEQITSRVDHLVESITSVYDIELIQGMLDEYSNIDENLESEIVEFARKKIRQKAKSITPEKATPFFHALFSSIYYTYAKDIAIELGFEHRGSKERILSEAIRWIQDGEHYVSTINSTEEDEDRIDLLINAISRYFSSREGFGCIKAIFEKQAIEKPSPARTSFDYISKIFKVYDDDLIHTLNALELNENDVKQIANNIFGDECPRLRKNEMLAFIADWVDYNIES
jgi:hypothetical protein